MFLWSNLQDHFFSATEQKLRDDKEISEKQKTEHGDSKADKILSSQPTVRVT